MRWGSIDVSKSPKEVGQVRGTAGSLMIKSRILFLTLHKIIDVISRNQKNKGGQEIVPFIA